MATIELFARDVWALALAWPWLSVPVALVVAYRVFIFAIDVKVVD